METIQLKSFNIHEQVLREGTLIIDKEKETITFPSGDTYTIVNDYGGWTYNLNKKERKILATRGIEGFCDFMNEINNGHSPFNPAYTDVFINL